MAYHPAKPGMVLGTSVTSVRLHCSLECLLLVGKETAAGLRLCEGPDLIEVHMVTFILTIVYRLRVSLLVLFPAEMPDMTWESILYSCVDS